MADKIFISYSKKQPEPTQALAAFLESEGYQVWWDKNLSAGEVFREVIDRELDAAAVVIVIWTEHSIASNWVIAEADHANRQGKLITVRVSDLEVWTIPKPYNTYHTESVDDHAAILRAIRRLAGLPERPGRDASEKSSELLGWSKSEWEHLQVSAEIEELKRFAAHAHPYYGDLALKRAETEMRRGRVEINAPIVNNAHGNWFLPGAGKIEWFTDFEGGPEMVVIPPGTFVMGSGESDPDPRDDEGPQHEVTIQHPFAIGVRRAKAALSSGCKPHPANSLQPEAIGAVMEVTR